MIDCTVIRGSSELSGSCSTTCTSRRNQRSCCGRPGATGRPRNVTGALVGAVEPEQDPHERRLAGAGFADDAEAAARARRPRRRRAARGARARRSDSERPRQPVAAVQPAADEQQRARSRRCRSGGSLRLDGGAARGLDERSGVRVLRPGDEVERRCRSRRSGRRASPPGRRATCDTSAMSWRDEQQRRALLGDQLRRAGRAPRPAR